MIEFMLKHAHTKKIAMKYQFFENLDFDQKEPKTSGFIDFSCSNMHFRSADAANNLKCAPGLRAPPR